MGDADVKKRSWLWHLLAINRVVTDDRGGEYFRATAPDSESADERVRYALATAEKNGIAHAPSMIRLMVTVFLAVFFTMFFFMITGLYQQPFLMAGTIAVTILLLFIVEREGRAKKWRQKSPIFCDIMLANGLCPACAYRVDGLPPQEDGIIRCAECGASWKGERLGEPNAPPIHGDKYAIQLDRYIGKSMFWSRRRIKDATGNERFLLDADYPKAIRLAESTDHRERMVDARKTLRRSAMLRRLLAGLFAALFLYIMIESQVSKIPSLGGPISARNVLRLVFGVCLLGWCVFLGFYFFNPRGHSANKDKAIDAMLRRRLCPSCGGDMIDEPVSDRPLSRCPRCLAVWRMPFALESLRGRVRQPDDASPAPTIERQP